MRSYRTTSVARNYQKPIIEENKPVSQGKCRALLTLNETSNYLLSQPDAHPLSISVAVAPFKDTNCKIKCKTFMKWQLFISHSLKSKWYYTCLCVYLKFFFYKKGLQSVILCNKHMTANPSPPINPKFMHVAFIFVTICINFVILFARHRVDKVFIIYVNT